MPATEQVTWLQVWNRLAAEYNAGAVTDVARAAGGELPLREARELADRLGEDLVRERRRMSEHGARLEEIVPILHQAVSVLAESGQHELAEQVSGGVVELCRGAACDKSSACLSLRHERAMILARRGAPSAPSLLGELLADCRETLGDADPMTATVEAALARYATGAPPATGMLPTVWNVEPRNPEFTGREEVIAELGRRFRTGGLAKVQVLRGWGGVGKTQIAIEYAHQFAADYSVVWWIDAEDPMLIGKQLAELSVQLGLAIPDVDSGSAVALLKAHLRQHSGWLLLIDNAEDPGLVRRWLPGGPGHVVITSRVGGWEHLAVTVPVNVMERAESVQLIRSHGPDLGGSEAAALAAELGDLPLALVQAGTFLAETATAPGDYLGLLRSRPKEVLSEGAAGEYPHSLAAAVGLTIERLARHEPVGLALARICSFLAPDTIPVEWLVGAHPAATGKGPLDGLTAAEDDALALRRGVGSLSRFGLAVGARGGLRLHRLTQSIIRDHLPSAEQEIVLEHARALLARYRPGDPEDPAGWAAWSRMVPHLFAVAPDASGDHDLREMACDAGWYLIERGEAQASARFSAQLYSQWQKTLGPRHAQTLAAARDLARALREQGDYADAARLYGQATHEAEAELGADDPLTLRLKHGSAINLHLLGRDREAYALQKDAFERYERVLGPRHPHTLHSANHLAVALHALGRFEEARDLHEETHARYREVLGDDHPDTLRSANNLAVDLRTLGDHDRAHTLQIEALSRRRRTLGEDHPHTLQSATSLAETLHTMGRSEEAFRLQKETRDRSIKVLGAHHPDSLHASRNLTNIQESLRHSS
ncbi:FxSxx-COOH system tetratricopeptide repeat protein [Nonomuraea sp. NPDC050394]|uniref:FxSxx-COOH system tetratricopeptide repeat protein n=1 Tax=Nonomuraea sp. NPDC050394 TaxID=3364363 RepID=UPI00378B6575